MKPAMKLILKWRRCARVYSTHTNKCTKRSQVSALMKREPEDMSKAMRADLPRSGKQYPGGQDGHPWTPPPPPVITRLHQLGAVRLLPIFPFIQVSII